MLILSLEWNKKLVGFYRTSEFSFTNFVGVGLDSHVNLSDWIRSLEKHRPLISAVQHIFRFYRFCKFTAR